MLPQFTGYLYLFEKICFILGAILYCIFSLVVVKQTHMMSQNVNDKFNGVLKIISYLHLAFALFVLFLTLTIL